MWIATPCECGWGPHVEGKIKYIIKYAGIAVGSLMGADSVHCNSAEYDQEGSMQCLLVDFLSNYGLSNLSRQHTR